MYAGDIPLCFRTNKRFSRAMLNTSREYEILTKDCINVNKSEIYFPRRINHNTKAHVCSTFHINEDNFSFKYLDTLISSRELFYNAYMGSNIFR